MMRRLVALFALCALLFLLCGCHRDAADEGGEPVSVGNPYEDLDFSLLENVENADFSDFEQLDGMFGGREYVNRRYEVLRDENGENRRAPKSCVVYTVTSFPDYADGGSFVTGITVTDPAVRVFGITVNSTPEEFKKAVESYGLIFMEDSALPHVMKATPPPDVPYSLTLTRTVDGGVIRIIATVTNREGMVF